MFFDRENFVHNHLKQLNKDISLKVKNYSPKHISQKFIKPDENSELSL
jgi:hypothetical protein